jgi:histidine phosphotransfer protein HptB
LVNAKIEEAWQTCRYDLLSPQAAFYAGRGNRVVAAGGVMIDWKRVEELREEIGDDDFVEVAGMFLEEADQTIEALSDGLAPEDVEGQLHFLKGSALNLGLADLAAICQDGERRAASGNGAQVDLGQIIAVYHASRAALTGRLARDAAA